MIYPQNINAEELSPFVPHSGRMLLLDTIAKWDDESIECLATSHRDPNNPLRINGEMSTIHSIEYAAQAISYHAVLIALKTQKPPDGIQELAPISSAFLAIARDFSLVDGSMDSFEGPYLALSAKVYMTGPRILQYWTQSTIGDTTISQGFLSLVIER